LINTRIGKALTAAPRDTEIAMLLRIQHETRLSYSAPVAETVFELRMAPSSDDDQTTLRYRLRSTPQAPLTSYRDGFGNRVDLFNIAIPYQELVVHATSFVRTHRRRAVERLLGICWPVEEPIAFELLEFLQASPLVDAGPALDAFVAGLPRAPRPLSDVLRQTMAAVGERLTYEKKVTNARTPLSDVLTLGRGVCQDFAHLFLGACRGLGLPARYVSGYVNHPGEIATHAWCQVWAGNRAGWLDVDPTAGEFPEDDHVVTAVGRDYSDVPPNRGVWKGRAEESMAVSVTIEPVERVPLEWNEWAAPILSPMAVQSQFQRQGAKGFGSQSQRQSRSGYPNQPRPRAALYQQQGQQQQ
jgi:transglutaminase-like putative cysteine protease